MHMGTGTASFENTNIYPEIQNNSFFYARYMDEIFMICTGREAKLNNFLANLNMMHDSIKFYNEKSTHSIEFLDSLIYTDTNRQLQTVLYQKKNTKKQQKTLILTTITDLLTPNISKKIFLTQQQLDYTDNNELE